MVAVLESPEQRVRRWRGAGEEAIACGTVSLARVLCGSDLPSVFLEAGKRETLREGVLGTVEVTMANF